MRSAAYDEVIEPHDREFFIRLRLHDPSTQIADRVFTRGVALKSLGLDVSTGRVVDFRSKQLLRSESEPNSVPLIYPMHLRNGFVSWPKGNARKPNALACETGHLDLIVPNGTYVLVKRFSAKEETRRIVAAVCAPDKIPTSGPLAFENHLNYYHANGGGLSRSVALGLASYLNTTAVDQHFREFSGHTQVNATDLRRLRYPPREALERIGRQIGESFPLQADLDSLVELVLTRHYGSECEAPMEVSAHGA
jgi:adenine-specific DNA-methyltransferase